MNKPSLLKTFARYVSSNVLGMLGFSFYILIDTFFISAALGSDGLTALNLAIPVYNVLNGFALMIAMGGATVYAISNGQKDSQKGNSAYTATLFLGSIASLLFFFLGLFFSGKLAHLLGADAEVFAMTDIYLKIILMYAPIFILEQVYLCFVRNDGAPRLAMAATLTGSFTNILLDYLFMFPMHMGMFGAVFATGISALIATLVVLLHLFRKKNHFHLKKEPISGRMPFHIMKIGLPALIAEMSSGIVIIVFNLLILKLQGNTGVAAYGVIANISLVVISLYTGIGNGSQPLFSVAYGEGKEKDVRTYLRYSLFTMAGLTVLIYAVIFFFADPITAIFNTEGNAAMQKLAVPGLKLYFTGILFAGFNIVISVYFASVERSLPAQIISAARGFFVIIPVAFIMAWLLQMTGVWLSFPAAEGITALVGILFITHKKTKTS